MIRIMSKSGFADALIDCTVTMSLEEEFNHDDKLTYYKLVINGSVFCIIPIVILDDKYNYTFLDKGELIDKLDKLRQCVYEHIKIGKDARIVVDDNGEYEIFDERVLE